MRGIHSKLIRCFIPLATIPMIVTTVMFGVLLAREILNRATDSIHNSLAYSTNELNGVLEESHRVFSLIQNDSNIQEMLRSPKDDLKEWYRQKLEINTRLAMLKYRYATYIDGIYIFLDDGRFFKGNQFQLYDIDFRRENWYRTIRQSESPVWFYDGGGSLAVHNLREGYVDYGIPLNNFRNGQNCGIVLIELRTDDLRGLLERNATMTGLIVSLSDGDKVILSTESGESSHSNLWGMTTAIGNLSNGWDIHFECSTYDLIHKSVFVTLGMVLGGIVLLIFTSVFLSVRFADAISSPVNALLRSMQHVEENHFKERVSINTDILEISDLMKNFNLMIVRIRHQFQALEKQQDRMRKAQFAALQAQIDPHFLYNTLDNIAWQVRVGNTERALQSIMAFSRFFRLSLSKGMDVVLIESELQHAELYLQIQQTRYEEQLQYEVVNYLSEEEMQGNYLPKLILQPLIENAIYHGIREKDGLGKIVITSERRENLYVFSVTDDGDRADEKEFERINVLLKAGKQDSQQGKSGGYGIYNVNQRIKYFFGMEYGVTLERINSRLTVATITVPQCDRKPHSSSRE